MVRPRRKQRRRPSGRKRRSRSVRRRSVKRKRRLSRKLPPLLLPLPQPQAPRRAKGKRRRVSCDATVGLKLPSLTSIGSVPQPLLRLRHPSKKRRPRSKRTKRPQVRTTTSTRIRSASLTSPRRTLSAKHRPLSKHSSLCARTILRPGGSRRKSRLAEVSPTVL
jgi:hypothetical protein